MPASTKRERFEPAESTAPTDNAVSNGCAKLVAYNVLAPWTEGDLIVAVENQFGEASAPGILNYDHPCGLRKANVVREIDDADLAVLVEVERPVVEDILQHASQCGKPLAAEVGWRNDDSVEWGSAVVWRTGVFDLVASTTGSLAVGRCNTQTFTAVLLRHVAGPTQPLVCVVAVHLKAGGAKFEEVREKQAELAIVGAKTFLAHALGDAAEATPIVIAGDFNSDRRFANARVDKLMKKHGFLDAGAGTSQRTYKHFGEHIFDYIYSTGIETTDYVVPDNEDTISPNCTQGSDHLPVHVTLRLDGSRAERPKRKQQK